MVRPPLRAPGAARDRDDREESAVHYRYVGDEPSLVGRTALCSKRLGAWLLLQMDEPLMLFGVKMHVGWWMYHAAYWEAA